MSQQNLPKVKTKWNAAETTESRSLPSWVTYHICQRILRWGKTQHEGRNCGDPGPSSVDVETPVQSWHKQFHEDILNIDGVHGHSANASNAWKWIRMINQLISVILLVDLRGIFIVRACHHLWGYTGPDEFSAIETGWRNQWPFNMAPHFLNIVFRFISWRLRYIHFNLIQEFPFLAFLLEGRSSRWLGLGLSARLEVCLGHLYI